MLTKCDPLGQTNPAALEATLIAVSGFIAAIESFSPVMGCIRALLALTAGVFVKQTQLPYLISGADPDRHGFSTPKRILRVQRASGLMENSEVVQLSRSEAMHKWASIYVMPLLLSQASSAAISFCHDHVSSGTSLQDLNDCYEVTHFFSV